MVPCHRDSDAVRLAGLTVLFRWDLAAHFRGLISKALIALSLATIASCGSDGEDHRPESTAVQPANRIISLAPHLTELLFTAGAGDRVVGVVEFSNFPETAAALPRVGDAFRLDYEAIAALEPDLILGWESGTPVDVLARLRDLGYRVVALDSAGLDNIADHLRTIGQLGGTESQGIAAAEDFERSLNQLRRRYQDAESISIFYQISARPMLTISRHHLIGQAIELCGGKNIFAALDELTPVISVEAVLDELPQVIMANNYSLDGSEQPDDLLVWTKWPHLPAVQNGNLYFVSADEITRPSVRILLGVDAICKNLDSARNKSPLS
jgi:iron complex transport system substrate-binding protein